MFSALRQVLANFLGSEKAMASFVVFLACTVLAAIGKLSVADWKEMSLWILGIYVGGKTIQGAATSLTKDPLFQVQVAAPSKASRAKSPTTMATNTDEKNQA